MYKEGWFVGITDGEGSFALEVKRRGPEKKYKRIEFSFKLQLRIDDIDTLYEAQRIMNGIGHVCYGGKDGSRHKSGNGQIYQCHAMAQWFVNTREELSLIIDFFRKYPLMSKKRRDFEVWSGAFDDYIKMVSTVPYAVIRRGERERSGLKRRPTLDTPRKQFRRIPEEIFIRMEAYAQELKSVRSFYYQPKHNGQYQLNL